MRSLRFPLILSALLAASLLAPPATAADDAPKGATELLASARAHRKAGATKEALLDLRRAATLAQRPADRELALVIQYEIARVALDRREVRQAQSDCRVLSQKAGGKALGHACLAEAMLAWRRASEASVEASRALALEPKLFEAKVAAGRALLLELRDKEAEVTLREALSLKPTSPEPRLALAELYALFGRTENATQELRAALKEDNELAEAHYQLGRLLPVGAEALSQLEAALRLRPNSGETLARLAEVQVALGKLDAARATAQRALRGDPGDASMRVVIGRVALAEGKVDVAHAEAKAALALLPNLASAKLLAADAYAKQGEIDLAIEAYQAAFGFDRTDPAPLLRASEACRVQSRGTTAKAFAERATRDFPESGAAWVALGDALRDLGDKAAAKQAYEHAAKAKTPADGADVRRRVDKLAEAPPSR